MQGDKTSSLAFGIALSDIVSYIRQCQVQSEKLTVLKFAGIKIPYIVAIKYYSIHSKNAHRTRVKEQLLSHIPGCQDAKKGRDVC